MKRILLSFLSGMLIYVALPPHDQWWCAWFSLVPLLIAIRHTSVKEAALLGLFAGGMENFIAFFWITELIQQFSELGAAAYLIMALMGLYQGIPLMLWVAFLRSRFQRSLTSVPGVLGLLVCAMSFPVIEYFFPIVFPWYLAHTQHTRPDMMGVVELAGCGGLSLAIVVANLALARLLVPLEPDDPDRLWPRPLTPKFRVVLVVVGLSAPFFCWGFSVQRNKQIQAWTEAAPALQVGLVQPNQWINGSSPMEGLHDYQRLSLLAVEEAERAGQPLDLLMWPESAVRTPAPRFISERGPSVDGELVRLPMDLVKIVQGNTLPAATLAEERVPQWELLSIQRGHQVPILFGSTLQDMTPGAIGPMPGRPPLYNCGVMVDRRGDVVGVAAKVQLLLFGETIPFSSYFPSVYKILPLASALMPGKEARVLDFQGRRLGMMVCYEDLLPRFHYQLAQKKPQVLLNLTNDAWFGKTIEAAAHMALSKFRTVEGRLFLVRSTPTGVSCVVDATGAVTGQIDQDTAGILRRRVALLDIETGFEKYGDSVVWLGLLLVLCHLVVNRRRRANGDF
jgi:apolipoprotein N-acyltransferase